MFWRVFISVLIYQATLIVAQTGTARWCCASEEELTKCQKWAVVIPTMGYVGVPTLTCVRGNTVTDCMKKIAGNAADLMTVDGGLAYYAGRQYGLMPVLSEKYSAGSVYSVALVKKSSTFTVNELKNKNSCHPGVWSAAGFVAPMSNLINNRLMTVIDCNIPLKTTSNHFNASCVPGAYTEMFNPYGNNPEKACSLCVGKESVRCTSEDPYAGYEGAVNCLNSKLGDVAWVKSSTISQLSRNNPLIRASDYEILCPVTLDKDTNTIINPSAFRKPVEQFANCNFGKVPNGVVLTSRDKTDSELSSYKDLLMRSARDFAFAVAPPVTNTNGSTTTPATSTLMFNLFESKSHGGYNLLFSDDTTALESVGDRDTYIEYVGQDFINMVETLNSCPIPYTRWCVISRDEKLKCEKMRLNFRARGLQPTLDCIVGENARQCMQMINEGDVDLINLDPSDVFTAGREFGIIPIAHENYGELDDDFYYAVAIVWKVDADLTIFNLRGKRTCHSGVGFAAGWYVPMEILLETNQVVVEDCDLYSSLGRFIARSCIPGILDARYNPRGTNPVNLCETCSAGGRDKCQRNTNEMYYGDSGAFRCLVENAGDVAFAIHTTVRDNTDGRNMDEWARNRRVDDFELLCKDGTRKRIDEWKSCYLAKIPGRAVVTAGYKEPLFKQFYVDLLKYGQLFFGSDYNPNFQMFDSGADKTNLMFSDSAVRIVPVSEDRQNYKEYLGNYFLNMVNDVNRRDCTTAAASSTKVVLHLVFMSLFLLLVL